MNYGSNERKNGKKDDGERTRRILCGAVIYGYLYGECALREVFGEKIDGDL